MFFTIYCPFKKDSGTYLQNSNDKKSRDNWLKLKFV